MITIQSFPLNYFSVNTYIVHDDTNEAVIIDCGCLGQQEEKLISEYIDKNELTLKYHLCTHLHLDHILGNAFIYKSYGLLPCANKIDSEILPSLAEQAQLFGLPLQMESVPIGQFLSEGDKITFGHSELGILLVPGHSPGSLVFYNEKNNCLFTGDTLFAGSIGRTDLWGGDMDTLVTTIKRKLLILPDNTIIYPGHGPESCILSEKRNNPFLQMR